MLRLGAPSNKTREMDPDDIFHVRLKLMIVMAKAYLQGCPMGKHRRAAMLENARHVEAEAIDLGGMVSDFSQDEASAPPPSYDHLFYQRVKLIAVMIKAAAKGFPISDHRRSSMQENIDMICQSLVSDNGTDNIASQQVA
ncbi:MAG: hypothetical protein HKP58_02545 [Desulfatitalea sp.]|nr:hypothetical protein [Desulfatitalea sp.]NNJ99269.1 hypothetical protein [Desulfatitalea sp.]